MVMTRTVCRTNVLFESLQSDSRIKRYEGFENSDPEENQNAQLQPQ
jgi:hypothetical protein